MAAKDVKLLGIRWSPFVNRVQFALNLKSVDYEFLPENFPAKSELLLKANPVHKKVPVLIHADKPVGESLVILQYIDEVWSDGPSLLPSDPYDRATARFWAAYIEEKWFPALRSLVGVKEDAKAEILGKVEEGVRYFEDVFVKSSNGKDFFGGDNLGYLDIVLGSFLGLLKVAEISSSLKIFDETKTPELVKWADKFCSHEAVMGTLPETEELLNLLNMRTEKAAADAEASK